MFARTGWISLRFVISQFDDENIFLLVEFCYTYLEHLGEVLVPAVSKPTVTQTYFILGRGPTAHLSLISKGKAGERWGGGDMELLPSVMGSLPLL